MFNTKMTVFLIFCVLALGNYGTGSRVFSTGADRGRVKQGSSPARGLEQYEGRYEMNPVRLPNFVVDISAKNNELLAQFSHRQSRKFRSEADDEFVDEEWKKIKLSFTGDMAGKVTGLVLRNIRMTYYFDDKHNVFSRMVPGETEVSARRLELPAPTITGNTTFVLNGYPNARIVALAGSFNDWNQSQTLFAREADRWVCRIDLPQGRYGYKFVVDGAWITDPGNPETEDDGHGNYNSVLDLPSAKH